MLLPIWLEVEAETNIYKGNLYEIYYVRESLINWNASKKQWNEMKIENKFSGHFLVNCTAFDCLPLNQAIVNQ